MPYETLRLMWMDHLSPIVRVVLHVNNVNRLKKDTDKLAGIADTVMQNIRSQTKVAQVCRSNIRTAEG